MKACFISPNIDMETYHSKLDDIFNATNRHDVEEVAGEAAPKRPAMRKVLPIDGFARAWTSLQATLPDMIYQRIKKATEMATDTSGNIGQRYTGIQRESTDAKKRPLQQGEDICGNLLQGALMQTHCGT
ncbi:hypothetical protein HHI36_012813 [Cryptolaemus montrouzieri]|uniref:Uncharacterized protein n=1 Tax=Cryptolaemus montrouzieri TaxID=559131 RepID=A0ABD2NGH8_9CUCU